MLVTFKAPSPGPGKPQHLSSYKPGHEKAEQDAVAPAHDFSLESKLPLVRGNAPRRGSKGTEKGKPHTLEHGNQF